METSRYVQLDMQAFCQATEMSAAYVIEIVEHGIVEPTGRSPEEWLFDDFSPLIARRAAKLHHDLDLEWEGVALALELLEEVRDLRAENARLRQRLGRFVQG
ncbi:chaperone modulator CbpM [Pseudomonas sp. App30]|uniref:chaperone modulator CbpM n=1 Tax=Pseudomonas sp. App30 TaxID=3068990 RepID=UPI003A809B98